MPSVERDTIAFLFPAFPVLHQTFVLWEVLALREAGVPLRIYSLKRPGTRLQQPEALALAQEVCYLPSLSLAVLKSNARALAGSPARYLGVFVRLVREWWRDRHLKDRGRDASADRDPSVGLLGIRERLRGFWNENALMYLLRSLALVLPAVHLGEELRRAGIRRIHAHWASYPTTAALVIRWIYGIPFSFTAHAYDIYLVPRLLPVKVRSADFVVTCARANATFLRQLGGPRAEQRVVVNYHGVDVRRFAPQEGRGGDGAARIVTCGRLQLYKGHHILLRAVARLSQPARCIIIGEGPQRANLERMACSLGIADRVRFTGPLSQAEVIRHYGEATLFVLASIVVTSYGRRDVIPNVLVEAMAMEVPVVSTRLSGISELVTDGENGRLVPPGDPDALARVIDELLADPAERRRLGRAGRRKVLAEFDRAANVRELAAWFRRDAVDADAASAKRV